MNENNIIGFEYCTSGDDFEKWVQGILEGADFDARRVDTDKTGGGVDIVATMHRNGTTYRFYIQCKFQNSHVGLNAVQEVFAGTHCARDYDKPVVITNNYATANARIYADKLNVEIIARPEWEELNRVLDTGIISNPNQHKGLLGVLISAAANSDEYLNEALKGNENTKKAKNKQELKEQIIYEFDEAEQYVKEAGILQTRATQYQQKALEIQKRALLRNITYD